MAKKRVFKIDAQRSHKALYRKISQNSFNLALGIIVFFVILFGLFLAIKKTSPGTPANKLTQLFNLNKEEKKVPVEKTVTVKEGDSLWKIAEETYGSGHNAYDIAKANKVPNPDLIYPDQKLLIPRVGARAPTTGSIEGGTSVRQVSSYTIEQGDSLWTISQKVYGDPYRWAGIAEVNSIPNPGLIYPKTVLRIP